jgi:hypothetical protein
LDGTDAFGQIFSDIMFCPEGVQFIIDVGALKIKYCSLLLFPLLLGRKEDQRRTFCEFLLMS